MIRFECDYAEGCIPEILQALSETNFEQTAGYGADPHCDNARELIKKACNAPDAYVQFLVGGTQANATVISACLKPYQGVLCAVSGHINVHETGAIEAYGHKCLGLPHINGKISAAQVKQAWTEHFNDDSAEHIVQPGMVYISHPTEYGTLYSLQELKDMYEVCRECGLYLFLDGARCGYGLMAEGSDVTLEDLAKYTDVFYIGGTKAGALFGEAVVITNEALKKDFRYYIKQHGGMLAKGRLLGVQYEVLFRDGKYFEIADHADKQAMRIRAAFEKAGVSFLFESVTNQQFPILTKSELEAFAEKYAYSYWAPAGEDKAAVRFCTSWATKEEHVDMLLEDIAEICRR